MGEKKIVVRELNTDDLFTLIDLTEKVNLDEVFDYISDLQKEASAKVKGKENKEAVQTKIGFKAIVHILKILGDAKTDLYKLLGDITGQTAEQIAKENIMDTVNIVLEIVRQEQFKDFLTNFTSQEKQPLDS